MDLVNIIRYIANSAGITVDFERDVIIFDDGKGPYIREWRLPFHIPTKEEMEVLEPLAQAWAASLVYKDLRSAEYPSIQDQLDMLYWDKVNGTNNWQAKITEIKEKYPKS